MYTVWLNRFMVAGVFAVLVGDVLGLVSAKADRDITLSTVHCGWDDATIRNRMCLVRCALPCPHGLEVG